MDYRLLGYLTLFLLVVVTAPYWLRTLNNWTIKTKSKSFLNLIKFLRKLHKPLGILLAVMAAWHGYVIFWLNLHTGLLAFGAFIITALLGVYHWRKKDKHVFKAHKTMALLSALLVALHLLWPSALRQLFGL